ncbi:hypothetical protein NEOC65_000432 [Neochlamydia sp. AcF65]|nr:hypothetical protein [Neochlamydia sp. AcF65]
MLLHSHEQLAVLYLMLRAKRVTHSLIFFCPPIKASISLLVATSSTEQQN